MAEFQEVMEEYHRMCNINVCNNCPISDSDSSGFYHTCEDFMEQNPEKFEEIVMKWSRENPKLIYPFVKDVVRTIAYKIGYDLNNGNIYELMAMRLNEDAANYLGIKPINDCKVE